MALAPRARRSKTREPLPPPARERLAYQPSRDPDDPDDPDDVVDNVLPVDETLARLREQMGWARPHTPT
ncbi:hypothetical protein AB0C27_53655 [Nonomuraea sp. NPDC048882]|uniref:hypothetical protein n=1 Tax=Nonomuraea sp. NPDC048882 TaxID=3154347 RepID=UPI0033CFA7D8